MFSLSLAVPPPPATMLAMTKTGFYSGSFDPVTLGHTDVIEGA